ncbi:hypothetical protein [Chryseobacterium luquanense]|uniref:Uncharacterized protein n=1 Tax=Chryseobacterium luquanense TaxID=2983766 RepID=A0ABT3Y245_9FLAO|nr:hypothetical protein [Chryseobacterium luquanense]MCX8532156.1 hypothetical protein [Chryseobacterium luquanense]
MLLSIDHTLISTQNVDIIYLCLQSINKNKKFNQIKTKKEWKGYIIFHNIDGITAYFRVNRFKQSDRLCIAFSPHKLYNKGVHNANNISFFKLQQCMISTLWNLGLGKDKIPYFKISSIELGVNFEVMRDPYFILDSAIMIGTYFFENTEYKHYKVAHNTNHKYLKHKLYIKSEQIVTSKQRNFAELGYCSKNIMRFEVKIERTEKIKFFDFKNLQNLFLPTTENIFKQFLAEKFKTIFFFSIKSLDRRKLKKTPQTRFYHQAEVPKYWKTLSAAQRGNKRKFYDALPKSFDLNIEMQNCFPFKDHKILDFPTIL